MQPKKFGWNRVGGEAAMYASVYSHIGMELLPGRRRGERGAGRLKAIFFTAILVACIYVGYKIVPPCISEYQLKDKITEEARFVTVNRKSDDEIRKDVMGFIQELDIPAHPEDIKLVNTQHTVHIDVVYTVPVDLVVYHMDLHFAPSTENHSLF